MSAVRLFVTVCVAGVLGGATTAGAVEHPKANDCSDPYWTSSLRCQYTAPGEPPQPNLGDSPADVAQIKPFTRVFLLDDPSVRSVDGTYPVMYLDKAICTTASGCGEVPRGGPVESDKWLITVPGGGSCHQNFCVSQYENPLERSEMSTVGDGPMKSLGGIHIPSAADNPVFSGYNRVRVEKSSYDRYQGRASWQSPDGIVVHSHGFLIMEQALRALRTGLHYETWVDEDGQVASVKQKLPALAKAEQVVFAGHSGGSHGLFHNVDHYAELLEGFGGFEGDVRAIFDENFVPGIENESGGDAYSGVWDGSSSVSAGNFDYDGEAHHSSVGIHGQQYRAWDAPMDASCLAAHKREEWICNERQHVLLNHVQTPFLVKEDFTDPNTEHNNKPFGHTLTWAQPNVHLTPAEFRARVMSQISSLIEDSAARSELGAGFPTFYAWINDCGTHDGVYADEVYYDTGIAQGGTTQSLREWVERFVAAPRSGASDFRVVGYLGTGASAICPPPEQP